MKALGTFAVVGGFVLSLAGAAFAGCAGHGQQSVKADVPTTVASGSATTDSTGEKK